MSELGDSKTSSPLNPGAPPFKMPSGEQSTFAQNGMSDSRQPTSHTKSTSVDKSVSNEKPTTSKQDRPQPKQTSTQENIQEAGAGVKLTGAQLKKQKAAEKAARRAEKVALKGEQAQPEVQALTQVPSSSASQRRPSQSKKNEPNHKRKPSGPEAGVARVPFRPGPSPAATATLPQKEKVIDKRVPMFSHLYPTTTKQASLATASRDIHPAVITLGLQLRDYVICGANARTVATLLVLKKVIQAYTTPPGVAISRHLVTHLSHQISFLTHARPLAIAQGNSIRWLKKLISQVDPDLAEQEAKSFICKAIDGFVREKVTLADEVISREASNRIAKEGDVILTYGKSSVVEKTLLTAMEQGKKFKVIVADSRPLFEGKNLARSLIRAGMEQGNASGCQVQYCLLNGLADVVENEGVTKCFLGASAMLGNGRLSSRAGTAMVACMAKEGSGRARGRQIPVIVLCESVKFTAKVALDSVVMNEVADPDFLVERESSNIFTSSVSQQQQSTSKSDDTKKGGGGGGGKQPGKKEEDSTEQSEKRGLEGWRDQPNLYLLNLMYDITPAEYLDMVISELGTLPPSAVPVVNGVHGGDE